MVTFTMKILRFNATTIEIVNEKRSKREFALI